MTAGSNNSFSHIALDHLFKGPFLFFEPVEVSTFDEFDLDLPEYRFCESAVCTVGTPPDLLSLIQRLSTTLYSA